MSGAMGGSRSRGVPRDGRERRGHLRALHQVRLRRQRRGRAGAGPRRRAVRRRTAPRTSRTPPTPRPSRRWSNHLNEAFPRQDRPWAAGDTLEERHRACSCTPTAPASRWPSACPVTATWTRSGSRPRSHPAEVAAFDEAAFAANPALVKGYIGPGALGEEGTAEVPLPARPPGRGGHPLGHRRQRARPARPRPRGRPRLHRRRHHRGRRGARRRRLPELRRGRPRDGSRHRDGPHLRARPQVRGRPGAEGPGPERQAGDRDDGLLRRRRQPCRGRRRRGQPRRGRPGVAARAQPRRRAHRGDRQGRGRLHRGRRGRAPSSSAVASASCTTTAARSPRA